MRVTLVLLCCSAVGAADLCQAPPEIATELKRFDKIEVWGAARSVAVRKLGAELMKKYPDNVFVLNGIERVVHYEVPDNTWARDLVKAFHDRHPADAGARALLAQTLTDTDTPRAIELAKTSTHPLARLVLANIYGSGNFKDTALARAESEAYFKACPDSLDRRALSRITRLGPEGIKAHSARLRKALAEETDPDRLRIWETVWKLDFLSTPVTEHDVLRKQVAKDAAALEARAATPDAELLSTIREGYSQAKDTASAQRIEDRLLAEFAATDTAISTLRERWRKQHPAPQVADPDEKKQEFYRALLAQAESQLKKHPGRFEFLLDRAVATRELTAATAEQVEAAGEALLASLRAGTAWSAWPPFEWQVAKSYAKRKIRLNDIPALIEEGWKGVRQRDAFTSDRDPKQEGDDYNDGLKIEAAQILIEAAEGLGKPEIARAAVGEVASLKPSKPGGMVGMRTTLGKFAELEGRKLDALLLYRSALAVRPADMKLANDELTASADRLMKELGGTAVATELLASTRTPEAAQAEGRWSKPAKTMPKWELSDLSGKSWKLASLEGTTVLINVWASWCGPCRSEHPHLQKLYEKLKDRSDIRIISFNIDDEIGKVQPYIDENKLTFPVLLAKPYVEELLPLISIPRNWIVDAKSEWRLEQIGFGGDAEWEKNMIEKLQSVAVSK